MKKLLQNSFLKFYSKDLLNEFKIKDKTSPLNLANKGKRSGIAVSNRFNPSNNTAKQISADQIEKELPSEKFNANDILLNNEEFNRCFVTLKFSQNRSDANENPSIGNHPNPIETPSDSNFFKNYSHSNDTANDVNSNQSLKIKKTKAPRDQIIQRLQIGAQSKNLPIVAESILELKKNNYKIDLESYSKLMNVLCHHKEYKNTINVFAQLSNSNSLDELLPSHYTAYIKALFGLGKRALVWALYERLKETGMQRLEDASIEAYISDCAKEAEAEKALRVYRFALSSGTYTPSVATLTSLCNVLSKRKDYFKELMELHQQMLDMGIKMNIIHYGQLLCGCSKAADINTAFSIWNTILKDGLRPDLHIYSLMLWNLSSVENLHTKLSLRPFTFDISTEVVVEKAEEVMKMFRESGLKENSYILNGFLAVLSNNLQFDKAVTFFNEAFTSVPKTVLTYQLMFKLFDRCKKYTEMLNFKKNLLRDSKSAHLISYDSWKAIIRVSALTNNCNESLASLKEMIKLKHKPPSLDELRAAYNRFVELELFDMSKEFKQLCLPSQVRNSKISMMEWDEHRAKVVELLDSVYGPVRGKGFHRGLFPDPSPKSKSEIC